MTEIDLNQIMILLKRRKKLLEKKYKIKEIGVFGSYVRGEQHPGSDVDIIVDYSDPSIDIFDFLDLKEYLSDLMQTDVDLVAKDGLKPNIGENILKEVVYA
jgi:predicted nucleotidyltransferase